ncbi:MAG: segregation/condensation protein A [archaeon]
MGIDFIGLALGELEKWDSQLVELVREEKINPWDIDITALTAGYLQRIMAIQALDFRIPGKAVITAAVLLKLKSEKLFFEERERGERASLAPSALQIDIESVPDLHPVRRIVERKITIVELVDALRSAFEVEKRKLLRKKNFRQIGVRITTANIDAVMRDLRVIFDDLFHARESIEFAEILRYKKFEIAFLSILHMANNGELDLFQEEWNGSITIRRASQQVIVASEIPQPSAGEREGEFPNGR